MSNKINIVIGNQLFGTPICGPDTSSVEDIKFTKITKDEYMDGLAKNYLPKSKDMKEIKNIKKYLELDKQGKPYTTDTGAGIYNILGETVLAKNGWRIEPLDALHEEMLDKPAVKLLHKDGGEQIYEWSSGKVVTDTKLNGTDNHGPGPYDTPERIDIHKEKDVLPWIEYGAHPKDPSTKGQRMVKLVKSGGSPYGAPYRNVKK